MGRDYIAPEALARAAAKLDPLPSSTTRLAALVGQSDWGMSEVEEVIALDPALTGRLLQFANSAASASLTPVATVRSAVIRVGIGQVLTFATATGVQKQFRRAVPEYGLSEGDFWRHAVATALAAELMPTVASTSIPPEAFTASLLHDVGKLVLARFLDAERLQRLSALRAEQGITSRQAEQEILGVHHGELGALVATQWKLPERLVEGIRHHHTPGESAELIAHVVHFANVAAKSVGAGDDTIEQDLALDPGTSSRLGLRADALEQLRARLLTRLDDVASRYAA